MLGNYIVRQSAMASQPQNIYDDPAFFSAYGTLPRSQYGLSAAPEWPELRHMVLDGKLPLTSPAQNNLEGHQILDLGCGYGWFARWARDNGAAYVKAVDISHRMISRAKQFESNTKTNHSDLNSNSVGEISSEAGDIESITFSNKQERGSYNLVYSSLTFHYVEDLARLYQEIHTSLKKDGKLVFSIEHPICSAPIHPGPDWKAFEQGGQQQKVWPLNCYSDEGWRVTSWLGVDGVRKYHRTVEAYVKLLLESGFTLTGFKDWAPSVEDVAKRENLYIVGSYHPKRSIQNPTQAHIHASAPKGAASYPCLRPEGNNKTIYNHSTGDRPRPDVKLIRFHTAALECY